MQRHSESRVWLITGISRGLGLTMAKAVLSTGDSVAGMTRDGNVPFTSEKLRVFKWDAEEQESQQALVSDVLQHFGRIDELENNAGYGLLGPVETTSEADIARLFQVNFQVNFHAPLHLIQSVLPVMRRQRSGHILNIMSVAALDPLPGSAVYAAAKSALDTLSHGLGQETSPWGISLTSVAPGGFRTDFLSPYSVSVGLQEAGSYPAVTEQLNQMKLRHGRQGGCPKKAARIIIETVSSPSPPRTLVLGGDAFIRTREFQYRLMNEMTLWQRDTAIGE
ncbi:SDR family NAD(P)-dependent oxidoreductase [[Erwinia] mediterraneensis]|uniref:SDR family NAD(P)-dependent oxidoreductase n=1 Tax=[Erwinia] mediterraneensis TaxID=2161819 RepID=UPI00103081B6|nr:SDR family NAD(P)-dependent oxidoreductase [[Erwinia] mediterraneensis]